MKPIIGITSDIDNDHKHTLNYHYVKAISRAGGIPLILPIGIEEDVKQVVALIDGLLVSGGGDLNPLLFDEEPHPNLGEVSPARDSIEIELVREMLALDKPILGICRGLQILNVTVGGSLFQDIHSQNNAPILQHMQKAKRDHLSHFVQVEQGTLLASIAEENRFKVNSFHHQAAKDISKPLVISGVASDGIVEAIESTEHRFVLGVQWHPEELSANGDKISLSIFEKFITACNEGRE